MNWNEIVMEPVKTVLGGAAGFVVTLVKILLILAVGWFVAKGLQKALTRVLKLARLDVAADRSGITNVLSKGEIKYTLSELIGVLCYWLVMLIVFVAAINALNLPIAADLLNRIVLYIPKVIAAIFILVLGMFAAALVGTIVTTTATNAGVFQAKFLGKLTQVVIMVFAIAIGLEQLNIGTTVVNFILPIILGAVGLAIAIAFGLGCKDIAGKFIADCIEKIKTKK